VLTARIAVGRNDSAAALRLATEAIADGTPDDDADDLRDLARLLVSLKRRDLSLAVFKRFVSAESPTPELLHALHIAASEGDEEYVLRLGQDLRQSGRYELGAIEAELAVLEESSLQKSAEFLASLLRDRSDDRLTRYLRMRQALLGIRADRADLIEKDPNRLPGLPEIDERLCEPVVHALRHTSHPLCAVEMAYGLMRKFPNSLHAHQAMILSVLDPSSPAVGIPEVDRVLAGTAVRLKDMNSGEERWYVLEELEPPLPLLNEISATSEIAKIVVGHSSGDEVELPEAFGKPRRFVIAEILHRFIYRFRDCLDNLSRKFPHQQLFRVFKIRDDLPANEAFAEILETLDLGDRRDRNAIDDYKKLPMPLVLLAKRIGNSVLAAMQAAATADRGFIRCSNGNPQEQEGGVSALQTASAVVFEQTAILTWCLLRTFFDVDVLSAIRQWTVERLVAERTMADLHELHRGLMSGHDRMGTARIGHDVRPQITPGERLREAGVRLGEILDFLKNECSVIPGTTLPGLMPDVRDQMIKLSGRAGVESMVLAQSRGALLWTDDLPTAILAAHHLGCRRVWTQVTTRQICDQDLATRVTFGLISLNYEFTSVSPNEISAAAAAARWDLNTWPLKQVLDYFARESPAVEGLVALACHLLRETWTHPVLGTQPTAITWRLLSRLGSRPDGRRAIHVIKARLDAVFGMHVVSAKQLRHIIDQWLSSGPNERLIIP
jgi:hypothetical protein